MGFQYEAFFNYLTGCRLETCCPGCLLSQNSLHCSRCYSQPQQLQASTLLCWKLRVFNIIGAFSFLFKSPKKSSSAFQKIEIHIRLEAWLMYNFYKLFLINLKGSLVKQLQNQVEIFSLKQPVASREFLSQRCVHYSSVFRMGIFQSIRQKATMIQFFSKPK